MAVIKYSIEKNLSIAIANYNNYTGVKANFQMPKLKEDEWDKIYSNISIISFLQGLNIGGKVYNGYSIINNTKNNEYVSENSIYIADKSSKNEELKDTSEDVKTQNKFAEATFGIHTGNGVVVNKLNFNGNEYSFSDLATKTSAQIGNIIIYYSGNQNGSSEKKGYYRFISNVATQGNFYLNYTSSWEYIGESYLVGGPDEGRYYQITDRNISGDIIGVLNTDFERRSYTDNNGTTKYFYPKKQLGSYSSIVNQSSSVVNTIDAIQEKNIYQYISSNATSIPKAYYTALGRERYSQYKTNRNYESTEESMPVITFSQGTSMRVLAMAGGDLNDLWETEAILPAWSTITVKRETYINSGTNKCIMQIDDGEEVNMEFQDSKFTYQNHSASVKIKFKFEARVSFGMPNAVHILNINIESIVDQITGKKYKTN